MKKYLLLAASALFWLAACENTEIDKPAPEPDEISVSFDNDEFDSKGGEAYVEVTSSGDWTLELKVEEGLTEDDYKWVEPSANAGSDGDMVIFEVKGNDSAEKDLEATFVFACGEATDEFTVRCLRKDAVPDKIELSLTEKTFEAKGGSVTTKVISSADWTLAPVQEGGYSWITVVPETMTGKNGDEVTFTVTDDGITADEHAEFIFTVGSKTSSFKIDYIAQKKDILELISEDKYEFSYKQQENIEVEFRTSLEELGCTYTGNDEGWLTNILSIPGDNSHTLVFTMKMNEGEDIRTAVATISGGTADPVEITFVQHPESFITVVSDAVNINQMGGDFNVTVTSNVEYEAVSSASWITFKSKDDNGVNTFTAESYNDVERTATITFTEKNPLPGTEAATATIDVTQKMGALIEMAADVSGGKAYAEAWNNPDPLNNLTAITMEAYFKLNNYYYKGSIVGIESNLLLLMGGAGMSPNQLGIEYLEKDEYGGTSIRTLKTEVYLGDTKWYHLAVTVKENGEMKVYVNGEEKETVQNVHIPKFGLIDSEETDNYNFFAGWSDYYGYLNGKMSEVRIWNKALTEDEINAPLHFYNVDPASPGLVAYWKFNEGEGTTIKDHTSNGNDLTSEGIVWTEVSLPE